MKNPRPQLKVVWSDEEAPSPPRKTKRLPSFFRGFELTQLLEAADQQIIRSCRGVKSNRLRPICNVHVHRYAQQDRLILILGAFLGLRVSEQTGLKVEDINRQTMEARVVGKRRVERLLPLPKRFQKDFEWWCEFRKTGYLLRDKQGGRLHSGTVNCRLRRLAKQAALGKRVHSHALRHTYATQLMEKGANLRQIQTLLGHASMQTVQVYTHCDLTQLREQVDKL